MQSLIKNPARLVPIAFATVILIGTAALMLPIARAGEESTPFLTALFTATSATAVTGLAVVDTATYWSGFGQAVIFLLFEIGGIGIMTSATVLVLLVARKLSLSRQLVVSAETRGVALGDVTNVLRFAVAVMLISEAIVAAVLVPHFLALGEPFGAALWHGVFHAGAAFTNAGFSTYPGGASIFISDPLFLLAVAFAVLVGGFGLPVYYDLWQARRTDRRMSLHTKLTLFTTGALYLLTFLLTAAFEWRNPGTLAGLSVPDRLVNAFYHGFMSRSCGMNAMDMAKTTEETMLLTYAMMFVGGGSASTAGGLKVSTLAILLLAVWYEVRGETDTVAFGRRISPQVQREALTVLVMAIGVLGTGIMALRLTTPIPLREIVFDAISAFANVGLSMNTTPNMPPTGQAILILLMFIGRTGTITVATALALRPRKAAYRFPEERPIVG